MKENVVCFVGNGDEMYNIGIEQKLNSVVEDLIKKGYNVFYEGGMGEFDKKSAYAVILAKKNFPNIKLFRILTYYKPNKEYNEFVQPYDGSIYPEIGDIYPKLRIIKKNEWMIDNSDIVVCHIVNIYKSGAYRTLKYAKKIGKPIIYI